MFGDSYREHDVEAAAVTAAELRKTLTAEAKNRPRLRTSGYFHADLSV